MIPFDQLGKIFTSATDAAGTLSGNTDFLWGTLKSAFTPAGLEAVSKGSVFLSEEALEKEIGKRIKQRDGTSLEKITCLADRIETSATATAFLAKISGVYQFKIDELLLRRDTQHLKMSMISEIYEGRNFLGRCACAIAGGFFNSLLQKRVRDSELNQILEFETEKSVILRFGELDAIKALKAELLPGFGLTCLDFVQCTGAIHVPGGIEIQLDSTLRTA